MHDIQNTLIYGNTEFCKVMMQASACMVDGKQEINLVYISHHSCVKSNVAS